MLIQSSHNFEDRGLDAYFTPPEATISLINIEKEFIPHYIWEPACGDGAISKVLKDNNFDVFSSDIMDYGYGSSMVDFFLAVKMSWEGIITNPPYKLAVEFAKKAISEVPYVAFLLRTNFLESCNRLPFFRKHPPARLWISSRRLPMMHRYNWTGPEAPSNTCYAWFIWDERAKQKRIFDWFDWADYSYNNESGSDIEI
jgi:hypothetical protein